MVSAKMRKHKKSMEKRKNPLDSFSEKRGRGRPQTVDPTEIRGRADSYRTIFDQTWDRLWPKLSQAMTDQEVIDAFVDSAQPYARQFVPDQATRILRVLRERKFPKRREAQIGFLADSLAGLGYVTPRSSRDISQRERIRQARAHYILRYEYYIECSCGFTGVSRDHACRECGAQIDFGFSPALSL